MKRIISIFILSAILLISACGAAPVELLDFLGAETNGYDFGGVEISISSTYIMPADNSDVGAFNKLFFDANTIFGDAILDRAEAIEKNLNVTLNFKNHARDQVRMLLMANSLDADIVNYIEFGDMQNFAAAGYLLPITDFADIIDLSQTEKYGGANVLEGAMINSVPYAVQPVSWPGWEPAECYVMAYNRDMFSENSIVDPQEFYENKTWTWDTFENEYLAKVNIETSLGKIPVLGTGPVPLFYGLSYSNDVQYVKRNAAGEYVVDATPAELIEALEEGRSWVTTYGSNIDLSAGYWDFNEYMDERALMTLTAPEQLIYGGLAYGVEFLSGLMPFPCGPSMEYGIWGQAIQRIRGFGITRTSSEPEVAAHVIAQLFEPFDDYIGSREEYYDTYVFASDSYDTEIYFAITENTRYDYTFDGGSDLFRSITNNLAGVLRAQSTVSEAVQSYSGAIESIAEEYIFPNYDYMYKNYYSIRDAE